MNLQLLYQIKVFDAKSGQVIRKGRKRKANSLLKNFAALLLASRLSEGVVQYVSMIQDLTGATRTIYGLTGNGNNWKITAAATDAWLGIITGSGDTAVDITDYALDSLIAHGSGGGELDYADLSVAGGAFSDIQWSGSSCWFTVSRTLTNASGANVEVKEIGIAANFRDNVTIRTFLIERTVLGSAVTLLDGQAMTITYQVKVST